MTLPNKSQFQGGCHCGAVAYQCSAAPTFQFVCHCNNCRRLNGGLRLGGMSFDASALRVEGHTQVYRYAGGTDVIEAHFCGRCGTPLFAFPRAHQGVVVVRANSLKDLSDFEPEKSMYRNNICVWERPVSAPTWRPPPPPGQ